MNLSDAIGLELERREKVMSEEVECDVCGFLNDCRNCATQQARIQAALEVYAGMEGFIPETAAEGYCLRIIEQMNKALLGQ